MPGHDPNEVPDAFLDSRDYALIVMAKPDGETSVMSNGKFTHADIAKVLRELADKLEAE